MKTFTREIALVDSSFKKYAKLLKTKTWQSTDISHRPEAQMMEIINVHFGAAMLSEDLDDYRQDIKPNIPWADRHFILERASGKPINPGETWKEWPYANSANNFLEEDGKFSHTYAERYWPKDASDWQELKVDDPPPMLGIRYWYGDLGDVIKLLQSDPYTRQAYLPVWFPEDTGVVHGKRVPCSLGYHFLVRDGRLNIYYPIRSCDYIRHFRDDIYLTVRLGLWILQQLRKLDPFWNDVTLGRFTMWIGSLHCFINDYRKLYPDVKIAQHQ